MGPTRAYSRQGSRTIGELEQDSAVVRLGEFHFHFSVHPPRAKFLLSFGINLLTNGLLIFSAMVLCANVTVTFTLFNTIFFGLLFAIQACWSADGGQVYAGRRNCSVDVWDTRQFGRVSVTGVPRLLKTLRNPMSSGAVSCVAAFPDGRHIAV